MTYSLKLVILSTLLRLFVIVPLTATVYVPADCGLDHAIVLVVVLNVTNVVL